MRVLFMGTPHIAVPPLQALMDAHQVIAVVTQPDRPKGRGGRVSFSPVKQVAVDAGLPVLQPQRVKDERVVENIRCLAPEVIVVMAFGQILSQPLLDIPKYGCINIHASLLPKYRGAAPINWALANGDKETGLATMRMDAGLDTGAVYQSVVTPLTMEDDAIGLTERLGQMAGPLILETLNLVLDGRKPTPQDDAQATLAPRLTREDGQIDWQRPATEILNRIRAFVPWPGSLTHYEGEVWKILKAVPGDSRANSATPGTIVRVDGDSLLVAAGDGSVRITQLQAPGKRAMDVRSFLNGHQVAKGVVLGG